MMPADTPAVMIHTTREGERWDTLAHHYYGDPLGYGRIIMANPQVAITASLPAGVQLLIPIIAADDTEENTPPWLR
ncbi:MAG: tail protein X [Symbiopectobacterium sp.]|uniref:tail protein X n=1 Tax=Symbiopectobacterium sp. TaxID=2952789 RepID=UPI0039EC653F